MHAPSAIKPNCLRLVGVIAFAMLLIAGNDCVAQQPQQSLFVIKTPPVQKTGYGQQPPAIRLAATVVQEDQTSPREDLDQESASDELKKFDEMDPLDDPIDLDDDVNELRVTDDEDLDRRPDPRPMTTWNLKPMSSINATMRSVVGKSPEDQSWQLTQRGYMPQAHSEKLFAWAAPDIRYNPLYFEDVALERYGQTKGFVRQQFASGFHFLKSATFLPYYSLYDPVNSCDGPLGYCRPGVGVNCVQSRHYFGNPFEGRSQRAPRTCRTPSCATHR